MISKRLSLPTTSRDTRDHTAMSRLVHLILQIGRWYFYHAHLQTHRDNKNQNNKINSGITDEMNKIRHQEMERETLKTTSGHTLPSNNGVAIGRPENSVIMTPHLLNQSLGHQLTALTLTSNQKHALQDASAMMPLKNRSANWKQ